MRSVRRACLLIIGVLVTAACGTAASDLTSTPDETTTSPVSATFTVTTTMVSSEFTRPIWVTAPDDADSEEWGTWPIVYLLHGLGGSGEGLSVMAAEIARHGVVVFAPDYRSTEFHHIEQDAECSYRYAMTVAEGFGGDTGKPSIGVGHSMGASVGLFGSMSEDLYGSGGTYDRCYTGTPRSDVIVAIAGCYYEFDGETFSFDTTTYTNDDAEIVMVVGSDDEVCEPWQSRDATDALRAAGHDVRLIEVQGGDHANVVFFDAQWIPAPDDPVGDQVVEIILGAIGLSG
ncbi:MAG: alpha/beta fold hydrolase [Acidimicrobiia bacterium]|nr:alpha/beta fold hydrolase [Acidimicrobiia bacterium]